MENLNKKIEEILNNQVTLKLCESAHRNTSHSPEARATQEQASFRGLILNAKAELDTLINEENKETATRLFNEFIDGTTKRFIARLNSKSNCFSVMITGGSNFNNAQHEKANDRERKKSEDLYSYVEYKIGKIKKALAPAPKSTKELLDIATLYHETCKKLNAIHRKKGLTPLEKLNKAKEITSDEKILKGFAWNLSNSSQFFTTNSNAKVKRLKEKLAKEEKFKNLENKVQSFDGLDVIFNYEIERYQILFDEIPSDEVRKELKKLGFKWSPKNEAWQTYLTGNGRYKLTSFIKWFKELGVN